MSRDEAKTAFEKVSDLIDDLVDPDNGMTKAEYREFLEQLEDDIRGRIDAADEDEDEEDLEEVS